VPNPKELGKHNAVHDPTVSLDFNILPNYLLGERQDHLHHVCYPNTLSDKTPTKAMKVIQRFWFAANRAVMRTARSSETRRTQGIRDKASA